MRLRTSLLSAPSHPPSRFALARLTQGYARMSGFATENAGLEHKDTRTEGRREVSACIGRLRNVGTE